MCSDGDNGQLGCTWSGTNFPKFNANNDTAPLNLACRFSGKDGKPESLTVSFRAKSKQEPATSQAGVQNYYISNSNTITPGAGFYGLRLRFDALTSPSNHQSVKLDMFSDNATPVTSSVVWSSNTDVLASDGSVPDGYNFWDKFHDYTFVIECDTSTTTKVTLYIDGQLAKTITGALDSNNRLYKFSGNLTGLAFLTANQRVDSFYVSQSRE